MWQQGSLQPVRTAVPLWTSAVPHASSACSGCLPGSPCCSRTPKHRQQQVVYINSKAPIDSANVATSHKVNGPSPTTVAAHPPTLWPPHPRTHPAIYGTHVACVFSEPAVAISASVLMQGANTATASRSQHTECCRADSTHTFELRGSPSHLVGGEQQQTAAQHSTACVQARLQAACLTTGRMCKQRCGPVVLLVALRE